MNEYPSLNGYNGQYVSARLVVGACPRPENVADIVGAQVRSVVNLVSYCSADAMAYVAQLPATVYWFHTGFWDGWLGHEIAGYPERLTDGYARHIVERAATILRDHSPTLVHCMAGIGRASNMGTILLAASEGLSIEEANAQIRRYRPVAGGFQHNTFWREAGGEALVALARDVLNSKP